jgi:hypothetical protein
MPPKEGIVGMRERVTLRITLNKVNILALYLTFTLLLG